MFRIPSYRVRMLLHAALPVCVFALLTFALLQNLIHNRVVEGMNRSVRLLIGKHMDFLAAGFSRSYVLFQEMRSLGETWNYARLFDNWDSLQEALMGIAQKKALETQDTAAFSAITILSMEHPESYTAVARDAALEVPPEVIRDLRKGNTGVYFEPKVKTWVYSMAVNTRSGENLRVAAFFNTEMVQQILDGLSREIASNGLIRHSAFLIAEQMMLQTGVSPKLPDSSIGSTTLQPVGDGYQTTMQLDMPNRRDAVIGCWFPEEVIHEHYARDIANLGMWLMAFVFIVGGLSYYALLRGFLRPLGILRMQVRQAAENPAPSYAPDPLGVAELDFLNTDIGLCLNNKIEKFSSQQQTIEEELVEAHGRIADLEASARELGVCAVRVDQYGIVRSSPAVEAPFRYRMDQPLATYLDYNPIEAKLMHFWLHIALQKDSLLEKMEEFLPKTHCTEQKCFTLQWCNSDHPESPLLLLFVPTTNWFRKPGPQTELLNRLKIFQEYGIFQSFFKDLHDAMLKRQKESRIWLNLASQASWFELKRLSTLLRETAQFLQTSGRFPEHRVETLQHQIDTVQAEVRDAIGDPLDPNQSPQSQTYNFRNWLSTYNSQQFQAVRLQESEEIVRLGARFSRILEKLAAQKGRILTPIDVQGLSLIGSREVTRELFIHLAPALLVLIETSLQSAEQHLQSGQEEAGRIDFHGSTSPLQIAIHDNGGGPDPQELESALRYLEPFLRAHGGQILRTDADIGPGLRFKVEFNPMLS